tara:strand:- start:258 stop:872 length:615 start_codon:yes stop_codon:yes gene_type:complete
MVMIPNYEFKMKLPIHEVNLLETKKIDSKTNDNLIQKILTYPDVMKHQTNVKANMTDWRMHMKDDDFNKVSTIAENVAKTMRYGSTHVDGDTHTKRKGQSPRLMTDECWGASYSKGEFTQEHNHWPALWSWCYYLQVPKGSSPLVFTEAGIAFEPKVGDLVVFSGQVQHSVPPCECKEKRVMMAGNIVSISPTLLINLASDPNY